MIREIVKDVLRPVLTPFRPGNVVMFHIGRCGSTVLGELLRQHPRIFWTSEIYAPIFYEWQRKNNGVEIAEEMEVDAIEFLREDMRKAFHRYYGFEIKPFHCRLVDYSLESYMENLDRLGFTHYILLDRKNRLRKIVSSIIAHQDKLRYHMDNKTKTKLKRTRVNTSKVEIDFDSKPLLDYLRDYDQQVNTVKALFESRNSLMLNYEDDIQEDPLSAYHRICRFLDLKPIEASVKLSRTNPFPLKEMIENTNEVRDVIRDTPYEWMLEK